jgi:hypothetical protein
VEFIVLEAKRLAGRAVRRSRILLQLLLWFMCVTCEDKGNVVRLDMMGMSKNQRVWLITG